MVSLQAGSLLTSDTVLPLSECASSAAPYAFISVTSPLVRCRISPVGLLANNLLNSPISFSCAASCTHIMYPQQKRTYLQVPVLTDFTSPLRRMREVVGLVLAGPRREAREILLQRDLQFTARYGL
jgi:hypothetical protein